MGRHCQKRQDADEASGREMCLKIQRVGSCSGDGMDSGRFDVGDGNAPGGRDVG
jgi:hypothetical protein